MPRFFVSPENIEDDMVTISGSTVRHITRVLRLKAGDDLFVLDGSGFGYRTQIITTGKTVSCKIIEKRQLATEPRIELSVAQSILKGEKMDLVIQKCVEIGARCIIPMVTERTVVRLSAEKIGEKVSRWQRIAQEAAQQSARAVIPVVKEIAAFETILNQLQHLDLRLILWEGEHLQNLKAVLADNPTANRLMVFIGPEGGFSKAEIAKAQAYGLIPVSLGPRILRSETAAIVASALILYELGDLSPG